jgi:tRNA(Arg) A34 adenosine deaminase TadA
LLRSLFAVVLGDPNWLKALRVLVTVEPCSECWKAISAVGAFWIGYFTLSASEINYGSRIASFIDFLAQVFNG